MRKLGRRQSTVMRSLEASDLYPGGGWYYGSHSETVAVLDSLVARDLVRKVRVEDIRGWHRPGDYRYRLNEGHPALEEWRRAEQENRNRRLAERSI